MRTKQTYEATLWSFKNFDVDGFARALVAEGNQGKLVRLVRDYGRQIDCWHEIIPQMLRHATLWRYALRLLRRARFEGGLPCPVGDDAVLDAAARNPCPEVLAEALGVVDGLVFYTEQGTQIDTALVTRLACLTLTGEAPWRERLKKFDHLMGEAPGLDMAQWGRVLRVLLDHQRRWEPDLPELLQALTELLAGGTQPRWAAYAHEVRCLVADGPMRARVLEILDTAAAAKCDEEGGC